MIVLFCATASRKCVRPARQGIARLAPPQATRAWLYVLRSIVFLGGVASSLGWAASGTGGASARARSLHQRISARPAGALALSNPTAAE